MAKAIKINSDGLFTAAGQTWLTIDDEHKRKERSYRNQPYRI